MITSLSMNPSIDRTAAVERFTQGGLNRILAQTDVAAGKGVNVALAARALGAESACIGLMYESGAQLFEQRLAQAGAAWEFVRCPGAVRVNMKVFDRAREEITELNASGERVAPEQLEAVRALALRHAAQSDFLVLTGSLPPGCPADFYRTVARDAAGTRCRVILDADGERLRLGLEARPFLIKPNCYELELLAGRKLDTDAALLGAALDCVRAGARVVAVSMGEAGALITDGEVALRTPGLRVEVRSTVAAGDTMIAGLAAGFARGEGLEQAFRLGVAAAAARCATPPEQNVPAELARRFAGELQVEKVRG